MTDPDTRSIAHEAVAVALEHARQAYERQGTVLPPIGSQAWRDAPWQVHVATLAAAGLSVLIDPRYEHIELKAVAVAVSKGEDWRAVAGHLSHEELARRRAQPVWPRGHEPDQGLGSEHPRAGPVR